MNTTRITAIAVTAALVAGGLLAPVSLAQDDSLTTKLQKLVSEMSVEQQAALYLLLSELQGQAPGAAEAAAAVPQQSPQEEAEAALTKAVKELRDAALAGNLDTLMNYVADDFDFYQIGGKEALRGFLKGAIDMGYIEMYGEDTEINTEDTEVDLEGDKATIYPLTAEGPWGSATFRLYAKKADGMWKLTGLDAYGI